MENIEILRIATPIHLYYLHPKSTIHQLLPTLGAKSSLTR